MNDARSFWKGFGLATGMALVFFVGRVSADPVSSVPRLEDYSRTLDKMASQLEKVASAVDNMNRSGVKVDGEVSVRGAYNSRSYPISVKND